MRRKHRDLRLNPSQKAHEVALSRGLCLAASQVQQVQPFPGARPLSEVLRSHQKDWSASLGQGVQPRNNGRLPGQVTRGGWRELAMGKGRKGEGCRIAGSSSCLRQCQGLTVPGTGPDRTTHSRECSLSQQMRRRAEGWEVLPGTAGWGWR